MEQQNTFGLFFYVKKKRLNRLGLAPIYFRITVNGRRLALSLQRSVEVNQWNTNLGLVNGNSKIAKDINREIKLVEGKILEYASSLRLLGIEVTSEALRDALLGKSVEKEEVKKVLEIFSEHNKKLTQLIGIDYSKSTVTKYKSTLKHIKNFMLFKYHKNDMKITDINNQFVMDFELYMKTKKACSHNTTMKYITIFKKIIKIAIANDWLKKDPFVNFKITTKKTSRPFLDENELNSIINKDFKVERLEQVKDMFLFSCFTGLAYSDLKKLGPNNIKIGSDGNMWVMVNRTKTDGASHIPVLPVTAKLIAKYEFHPYCIEKKVLLPVLSNQKMNSYLKEIADVCGIDKKLTTHIARHTFATTVTLNNDVPIETVSKMLGHSSIKMTKIYAKLLDKKVGRDMQHLHDKFDMAI